MNEVLYKKLCDSAIVDRSPLAHDVKRVIDEFFEANICIPKGENRHPYADVLHEWVEGAEIEYLSKINNTWCMLEYVRSLHNSLEYRIKPSEPIYEWQWAVVMDDNTASVYGFHTEKSINEIFPDRFKFRMQNTQRERT